MIIRNIGHSISSSLLRRHSLTIMTTTTERMNLDKAGPIHPPEVDKAAVKPSVARQIRIQVLDPLDHEAPAILHEPRSYNAKQANQAGVIMISGAGGGVSGPAGTFFSPRYMTLSIKKKHNHQTTRVLTNGLKGIYPSLADKLALTLSVPSIRLDYRKPAQTDYCTADVRACIDYLSSQYTTTRVVLVGWSFGGSPCFTVAATDPERVMGVATIASQTAATEGIQRLRPRPVLLLHGTEDTCLSPSCAERLYDAYGAGPGKRELRMFDGDDHGLTKHAVQAEKMLFDFIARTLGFDAMLDDDYVGEQARKDLDRKSVV